MNALSLILSVSILFQAPTVNQTLTRRPERDRSIFIVGLGAFKDYVFANNKARTALERDMKRSSLWYLPGDVFSFYLFPGRY